jgi:hypothetical protein
VVAEGSTYDLDSFLLGDDMKARMVVTAFGGNLITEAHENRCWDGEEVASEEIDVPAGTMCDICDEEITEEA